DGGGEVMPLVAKRGVAGQRRTAADSELGDVASGQLIRPVSRHRATPVAEIPHPRGDRQLPGAERGRERDGQIAPLAAEERGARSGALPVGRGQRRLRGANGNDGNREGREPGPTWGESPVRRPTLTLCITQDNSAAQRR